MPPDELKRQQETVTPLVPLAELLAFLRDLPPWRYPDRPGYVEIDPTPKEVADILEKKYGSDT